MEQLLAFVDLYLDAEWTLHQAYAEEKDNALFMGLRAQYYRDYFSRVRIGYNRASYNENYSQALHQESRRIVFQIKEYRNNENIVFRVYIGDNRIDNRFSYAKNLYINRMSGSYRIMGVSQMCAECTSLGIVDGGLCESCAGEGWRWFASNKVNLGSLVKVHKIQAPTREKSLQEYEAE